VTEFFRRKMAFFRQVHAFVVKTVRSLAGAIRVTDAVAGNAQAVVVEGDAWVRNQLVQNGDFADGTTGWTLQHVSATVEGNVATVTYEESSTNKNINQNLRMKLQPGRTYCARIDIADAPAGMMAIVCKSSVYAVTGSQWHTYSSVVAITSAINCFFAVYNNGTNATVRVRNVQVVDLTQLCNGDAAKISAITSWDDLVAQYPEYASYVAYNTGEVVGLQATLRSGEGSYDGGEASAETLYAAGTARDLQDVVSGEVTRRIGTYTFTGEEAFNWSQTLNAASIAWETLGAPMIALKKGGTPAICNTLVRSSHASINTVPYGFFMGDTNFPNIMLSIYIKVYGCTSAADVQAWLVGHPTTIYYELATPTTSTVTAQPLALQKGSNSIYQTEMTYTATP